MMDYLSCVQGLFGWIGDPITGLLQDRQAAVEVADQKDIKELELKYIRKAESEGSCSPISCY